MRKLFVIPAATLLTALTLAAPAWASPAGAGSVRDGKNITVFHNSDFVAVSGYHEGEEVTVDLYRGPHRIATAFGTVASEGGGLEINHGPAGTAAQGDCWEGYTPDILPGDHIKVTDSSGTDEAVVDDIAITSGPTDETSTPDPTDVVIEGRAAYADGTPIPINQLDAGELRHDNPRFRATPNTVERTGTPDGWKTTYKYPYKVTQIKESLTVEERKQAILNGDHAMGYGHVVPLPLETQIAESPAAGGPALDCGNPSSPHYAPKQTNAVTTSDDRFVNPESGSLKFSGVAGQDVTAVSVTLSDGAENTIDPTVGATELTGGPGEKAWSAEFTRPQIESLADGSLTASGTYTLSEGSTTPPGGTKKIQKDLVAPPAPSIPSLDVASDTGDSSTDNLTKDTTPTFIGTAEAGSNVKILVDGVEKGAATATDGSYSITTSTLASGAHSVIATATDAAGNTSAASSALDLRIDTIAPLVSASPEAGTYDAAQSVTLTANEMAKIYFTKDGTPPTTASSVFDPATPIDISMSTTLMYMAVDEAANKSAIGTQEYVIQQAQNPPPQYKTKKHKKKRKKKH